MARIEKTVFISYRRTNVAWALAISQNLTHSGFDVFFDFQGIASGDFEQVILENIRARAHFVVLLTPSALERVAEPGDWLRREIETAVDTQRNVVPLMMDGFDFKTPAITKHLTGPLSALRHYNALPVPPEYFSEAMQRLRERFLAVPLDAVLHPASRPAMAAGRDQQRLASAAPAVSAPEISAGQWFERGFQATDAGEKMRCYSEAIRLKPDYAIAYYTRGNARKAKGDVDGAIGDYNEAIRLKPDFAEAYNNRGVARDDKGDVDGAIGDYNEAIRLKPDFAIAYNNRGIDRQAKGDVDGAIGDYQKYLDLGGGRRYGDQAKVEGIIRKLKRKIGRA
jgi:hypothetical protein